MDMKIIIGACMVVLCVWLLYSCNDKIEVKQDYDFALSSWHLQSEIKNGEEVEIRLTLRRQGDFLGAEYYLGYIQMEGNGEVYDSEGTFLMNRELCELREISGLDGSDPSAQVFTLFYRALSDKKSVVKFVIEDNFHQHRELEISFSNDTQKEE